MNTSLLTQLQSASKHMARLTVEAQEVPPKKPRMVGVKNALFANIPIGKENAKTYQAIRETMRSIGIDSDAVSHFLCVFVKNKEVKRYGNRRAYLYYLEAQ